MAFKISIIDINNLSNFKYRKILLILFLSNIARASEKRIVKWKLTKTGMYM
jgi:hypothetical protein